MNELANLILSGWAPLLSVSLLTIGIGIGVAIAFAVVILAWQNRQGAPAPRLRTDQGHTFTAPVDFNAPNPTPPSVPDTPTDAERRGRQFVRRANTDYNCMGHVFHHAFWEIGTEHMDRILEDNYELIESGAEEVCCIIVWYGAHNAFAHVGLVVEVPGGGKPITTRSKDGTSSFVFDHKPDEVPGAPIFRIYRRRTTDGLSAAAKRRLATAKTLYDQESDKSSTEARRLAEMLCQERNALIKA